MTTSKLSSVRLRWAAAAVGGLAILASAGRAAAATGPSPAPTPPTSTTAGSGGFNFGIRPYAVTGSPVRTVFDYSLSPGQTITDRVELINDTSQPKQFYLYGADAYTAQLGGGYALTNRTDHALDAGRWIALPVNQYTVSAESAAIIPIQIKVSPDAAPGDHSAGIVAEEVVPSVQGKAGTNLRVIHRVGARVYIRVTGALHPSLGIQNFILQSTTPAVPFVTGRGQAKAVFLLVNTGNTRIQLDQVTLRLTGVFGRTVSTSVVRRAKPGDPPNAALPDQLLPGNKLLFTRLYKGLPPLEHLTVTASVAGQDEIDQKAVVTSRDRGFWEFPWPIVVIVIVAAGVVVLALRRRRGPGPSGSADLESLDPAGPVRVPVG